MLYEISIEGAKAKLELTRLPEKGREVYEASMLNAAGASTRIKIEKREPDVILLTINNKMYQVKQLKRTQNEVDFLLNGNEVKAVLGDSKQNARTIGQTGSDVATVNELVSSNFPGKVVSVPTKKGSLLKEGDTILVLEAMKMDAQIKAPKECTVVEVFVNEGDMVSRGSKLAQLKFS